MAWFKVDDKLHSHTKAARAGVDAMGLWVLCGSWSADQLTDGFVPDYIALRLDVKARSKAARLVSAGLWNVAEKCGDRGWSFHDWADMQPTRADVESKREQEREKKRRWREKASRGADGRFTTGDDAMSPGESLGESTGDTLGSPVGSPPVSRPDPTRPERNSSPADADERASTIESEFNTWYLAYPRRIGKGQARKAYTGARKKADPSALHDAALAFASRCKTTGTDPKFIPHPSTWLNGERWLDQAEPDHDDSWDRYRYDPDTLEGA